MRTMRIKTVGQVEYEIKREITKGNVTNNRRLQNLFLRHTHLKGHPHFRRKMVEACPGVKVHLPVGMV